MDKQRVMALINRTITFERADIDRAEAEMHRDRTILSSVSNENIFIGLTANKTGTQYFSGYADGFFIAILNTYDDGMTFVLDSLQIPPWLLDALGTPLEDEARRAARDWSVAGRLSDAHFAMLDADSALAELRQRISAYVAAATTSGAGG